MTKDGFPDEVINEARKQIGEHICQCLGQAETQPPDKECPFNNIVLIIAATNGQQVDMNDAKCSDRCALYIGDDCALVGTYLQLRQINDGMLEAIHEKLSKIQEEMPTEPVCVVDEGQ